MRSDFDLSDLEAGTARAESFQSDQERRNASAHARAVAPADGGKTGAGGGVRGRSRSEDAPPSVTTMVKVATTSRIIRNRCIQGSDSAHSTINNSCPNCSSSSSGDIRSRSSGDIRSISSTIPGSAG